jgi:DNA polymerase-3 subunit delta
MIDLIAEGNAPAAFKQLDRLIAAGEHPIALLAQMASTFRRFAAATRLLEAAERERRKVLPRQILEQAGFKPFVIGKAEDQWKQLGRKRSGRLYELLLEADMALKGRSSQAARARLVLERFIAQFSKASDPRKAAGASA